MAVKQNYNTKARKYILEYLEKNKDTTISAGDIIEHLNFLGLGVSITTVYRYLNRLASEKKVIKFSKGDGQTAVYQIVKHNRSCDGHIHIQCVRCGKLIHLDCEFMDSLEEHLIKNHNFSLQCKGSILYGVCSKCEKDS